ncbi:MAG: OmpW family protein [Sphingomonadales bacterium]|nr:OmpW family protein [Sphingomonadales bacterium]
MKKYTVVAAALAATMLANPAHAGSADGRIQVKVLATGVLPDGKIDTVKSVIPSVAAALGASPDTKANDNVVPTIAVEYYATPSVSIETICCLTTHHVTGTGSIAGAAIANHVMILPATVTLKYHLDAGAIKPYVGVGPALFFFIDEKPGATAKALGASSLKINDTFGLALQAGVDIPVNDTGMGISFDAKRYFIKPTTHFYTAAGVEALSTKHKLDPWVISGGVYFRF